MKIIVVDDRTEVKELKLLGLPNESILLSVNDDKSCKSLFDLAHEVRSEVSNDNNAIIFINLFLACSDAEYSFQQNKAGIALLKFLRLLEIWNHVVLISPYSLETLVRQDIANIIVTTKGVSLTSCSYDFSEYKEAKLGLLAEDKFEGGLEKLKPYFRAGFTLPEDERHNWANWWGIVQLIDVHRSLFPNEIDFKDGHGNKCNYPPLVDEKLKQLRNLQALKIYNHDADFSKVFDKEVLSRLEKEKPYIDIEISVINEKITETSDNVKGKDYKSKPANYLAYLKKIVDANNGNVDPQVIIEINELENEIKKLKEKRTQLTLQIQEIDSKIQSIKNKAINVSAEVSKLRFVGQSSKPKILYIDDQANEGWADVFQLILFGKEEPDLFYVIQKELEQDINEDFFSNIISPRILSFKPDIILLDLRLKREPGVQLNVEDLSGAFLLKLIRNKFGGIPIIMTSASNKIWSYEKLISLGADSYWNKEGIDERRTTEQTVKNYYKFIDLICKAYSLHFQFLRNISEQIQQISNDKNLWWKSKIDWNYEYSIKTNYEREDKKWLCIIPQFTELKSDGICIITSILEDSLSILREYLKITELEQGYNTFSKNEWFIISEIIQHTGKIMEIIHGFDYIRAKVDLNRANIEKSCENYHYDKNRVLSTDRRNDKKGYKLYDTRNDASHYFGAIRLTWEDLQKWYSDLFNYLVQPPRFRQNLLQHREEDGKFDIVKTVD